jgi:inosine-uridine nucleoside N-ribohydrolase
MNLIILTDLGHDPDDFFAICYLIAAGVNIRAIDVHPGDPDQLAFAHFIREECGLDFVISAAKEKRTKESSGSVHHHLLKKYGYALSGESDCWGMTSIFKTLETYPDSELFIIGPATSFKNYGELPFNLIKDHKISRATMQGGFLPYCYHAPAVRLDKFENQFTVPTFNLNGDKNAGKFFVESDIPEKRFVGKNVCHTILYNADIHLRTLIKKPNGRAAELFIEGMNFYLERQSVKAFHDPTAAVCHLHPEVGTWIRGKPFYDRGQWGTQFSDEDDGDLILADINRDLLWEYITNWK